METGEVMMLGLFNSDNYLNTKFLNKNYRSIEGWKCQLGLEMPPEGDVEWVDDYLHAVVQGVAILTEPQWGACGETDLSLIRIPKFTSEDILDTELCWFETVEDGWILSSRKHLPLCVAFFNVVPFLIADTEEDAKKMCGWDKV